MLIIISVSPLISMPMKSIIILMLFLVNRKHLYSLPTMKAYILVCLIMLFILNIFIDIIQIQSFLEFNILSFFFPLCFLLGIEISEKYDYHEFIYILERIIFLLAIFSLVGVFIYTFIPQIVVSMPSYDYYQTTHKTGILFNILIENGSIISRNTGIASEPGLFQLILNLGLYSHLKLNRKIHTAKLFIYGLAIFFTNSTVGLIIFGIIIISIIIKDKSKRWLLLLILLISSNVISNTISYQVEHKLFGSYAFNLRLEPSINALKVGLDNLLGLGNAGYDANLSIYNIGAWDSFGQIFIRYGLPLLFVVLALLFKIFTKDILLFLIIFLTFLGQGIWYVPLMTSLYFFYFRKNSLINKNYILERKFE